MAHTARTIARTVAAAFLLLAGADVARAQDVIVAGYSPPAVSYYYAAPRVLAYAPATVAYYTPSVTYYPARTVSYYAAPAVSYYPGPVTAARYGLLGRPRWAATYYPSYVLP